MNATIDTNLQEVAHLISIDFQLIRCIVDIIGIKNFENNVNSLQQFKTWYFYDSTLVYDFLSTIQL
jgi:hypothetical protein